MTEILRERVIKHHLVEVIIHEHHLIVFKLIKDATRDLGTGI